MLPERMSGVLRVSVFTMMTRQHAELDSVISQNRCSKSKHTHDSTWSLKLICVTQHATVMEIRNESMTKIA